MLKSGLAITLALASLFSSQLSQAQTPEVGQRAPAFTLSTPDGKQLRLSQFAGKTTVVLIVLRGYPGYECPYCVRQVHDFVENASSFARAGAQVVLVYPGPPAELDMHAREFLAKQDPLPDNVHLVIDPDYKFTNLYGLRWDEPRETAYPATFLIDHHDLVFFRKISREHGDRTTAAETLAELKRARAKP